MLSNELIATVQISAASNEKDIPLLQPVKVSWKTSREIEVLIALL
jgi:hypothetical protein